MEVLENPSIQDRPGPNGTLVVVGLDPVASVAALNDERATAAADAMPRSKYLAIIDTLGYAGVEIEPGLPKLEYQFLCIGRGLPVEGFSAVPIYPAPVGSLGRTAVAPSSPLPWSDCYVHTLGGFNACISRVYKSSRGVISISEDDLDAVLKHSVYDQYRHGEEAAAAQVVAQTVREDPAPTSPTDHHDDEANDFDASPAHSSHPHSSSSDGSYTGSGSGRTASPFQPRRMDLHMEMWLELDAGHELADPKLLTSELDQLESIEREWATRMAHEIVTKRSQTSAWLQNVAEDPDMVNGSGSIVRLQAVENARTEADTEDNDIVPEDAIEHRLYSADGQGAQGILPGKRKVSFAVHGKSALKALASRLYRRLRAFLKMKEERNPPR